MKHFVPTGRCMRWFVISLTGMLLSGCATFSGNGGFDKVEQIARERLNKDVKWQRGDHDMETVRTSVQKLLVSPLPVEDAIQIALLNNPGLQATYFDLGIAEADLVQAGRMTNPHLAYLWTSRGGERKVEWSLIFPIVDLLTIPLRTRLEARRFEQVKLEVASRMIRVATDTRYAWINSVAAEDRVRYLDQVRLSTEASSELATRMEGAGNISRLARMQEQLFHAETIALLAKARQGAVADRERLTRLMGLSGDQLSYRLPERLPELPADLPVLKDIEQRAMNERLDIQAAKRETERLAGSLGLTRATRFVNVLELGPAFTKEDSGHGKRGIEVSLQLPIFDWGEARVARAESTYMQSVHHVAALALNARSEVREAYSGYRSAYETAKLYRDEIVPLRKKIADENQLRYNGMLIGPFELLSDARAQLGSVIDSIEALRAFWVSENAVQAALNGAPDAGR